MTTRSRRGLQGLVAALAWVGLVVMSACAGEDPEAEVSGAPGVEPEGQGEGQCCGPPPCGACNSGLTCCSAICRNTLTDNNNCGTCGHHCTTFITYCSIGHCCPIGQVWHAEFGTCA